MFRRRSPVTTAGYDTSEAKVALNPMQRFRISPPTQVVVLQ